MKFKSILFTVFLAIQIPLQAQDYIYLKNKEVLEVKILEIGLNEVKYKNLPLKLENPILTIEKYKIEKISLESGESYTFEDKGLLKSDYYTGQKRRNIQASLFSPLNNVLLLSYEQSLQPGMSYQVDFGGVGLGYDFDNLNSRGAFTRVGIKFIKTPDYYNPGVRYGHILQGLYFKPELVFTGYSFKDPNSRIKWNPDSGQYEKTENQRESNFGFGILFYLGKQYIFAERVSLDINAGLGYGATRNGSSIYGFWGGGDFPMIFNISFKLGYLF